MREAAQNRHRFNHLLARCIMLCVCGVFACGCACQKHYFFLTISAIIFMQRCLLCAPLCERGINLSVTNLSTGLGIAVFLRFFCTRLYVGRAGELYTGRAITSGLSVLLSANHSQSIRPCNTCIFLRSSTLFRNDCQFAAQKLWARIDKQDSNLLFCFLPAT